MLVRTEFSFRVAYGRVEQCFDRLPAGGIIADHTTYGHVPWAKEAKKRKVPRGLGARVRVGEPTNWAEVIIVPTSARGLQDLYGLVGAAARAPLAPTALGPGDWALLRGPDARGRPPQLPPEVGAAFVPGASAGLAAAFSDNRYPGPEHARAWAFALGAKAWRTGGAAHIQWPAELAAEGAAPEALQATVKLLEAANDVPLPTAQNIRFPCADAAGELAAMCRAEITRRRLGPEYAARLELELGLIADKAFADYFLVIAEMIAWAKARMLVGPGRGSSAGSIVCWLLRITEIDPLRHKLLFERFVDANRFDLPDIDIDFPDEGRGAVLEHLAERYGQANVAHIGTVMRYKPKSALTDVAKELKIPPWELDAFKDVLIERSSGDSRVNDCLRDSLLQLEAGRKLLEKYPDLAVACELEGGARQSGKHAAGMIVCNAPVQNFCAVDHNRIAQLDKKMAEALNILKIDALGLRTLSVLQTAADVAGLDRDIFYTLPLDNAPTLDIFNRHLWSGIFQFEGHSLQSLGEQIHFKSFEDIAALTALARPGPLGGGGATRWIEKHEGRMAPEPLHPALTTLTADTYGEVLYQEQVMTTCREVGRFSWADTAAIRKLMSNRQGDEAFRKFEDQFMAGAILNGMGREDAHKLWRTIDSMGSWAFNRSHSVAYGLLSYWCGYMKANHPLAFAAGCLRHAKDDASALQQLRELDREGIQYVAFDPARSLEDWAVVEGQLLGGLLGLRGVGRKKAAEILRCREFGLELKPGMKKLLAAPSVFAAAFPCRQRFGAVYRDPVNVKLVTLGGTERALQQPEELREVINIKPPEAVCILGRLIKKNLRDLNEARYLVRRNDERFTERTKMLILHIEDDTGRMIAVIDRDNYEALGAPLVEKGVVGETWLALRGWVNVKRFLNVQKVMWLQ